jgi:acyl-CoA reductase-like NAD-dependent aldehyde dehydrogenase
MTHTVEPQSLDISAEAASYARRDYRMLINGELLGAEVTAEITDPASGLLVGEAPIPSATQVDQAVAAATAAFPAWSATAVEERSRVVLAIADAIAARAEEVARLLTLEQGKIIAEARAEIADAVNYGRWFSTWRPEERVLRDDERIRAVEHRRPLGVVAAIVPWNFPFHQAFYKIAPALMTGNTVVLKPAPSTPLTAMWMAELIADMVPAGVVNIVGDGGETGPRLTAHPDVAKVSFTGSTPVGKAVLRSTADTLKRVTLELGGNDPVIVLDDVDVQRTAKRIFGISFVNAGQVCISAKRIFVHDSIYDEFCDAIAAIAENAAVGHGLDESNRIGPVQNAKQFAAAKDALARGAADGRIIAGGKAREGTGYFIEPTIIRDIADDSPVVAEETFAPIRSILSYQDLDEVVRRANSTPYGLGASVWSTDDERAHAVATRLDSGTVWINQHMAVRYDVPFGGVKQSGLGCEFGEAGILEFTARQVINQARRKK